LTTNSKRWKKRSEKKRKLNKRRSKRTFSVFRLSVSSSLNNSQMLRKEQLRMN